MVVDIVSYMTSFAEHHTAARSATYLAMRSPLGANKAQEKSSLSLMLVETLVFCSATPIASATLMKRLAKSERRMGSAGELVMLEEDVVQVEGSGR